MAHVRDVMPLYAPTVNSYKRYVDASWAPTRVAWSVDNRTAGFRIVGDGASRRVECRIPGADCNPYLALAVQLAAGLDGLRHEIDPGPPVDTNVWELSEEERARYGMETLPANLFEAVEELSADRVLREALGEHIYRNYTSAQKKEWAEYIAQVTEWELDKYLATY